MSGSESRAIEDMLYSNHELRLVGYCPNTNNISQIQMNPATHVLEFNGRPVSVVYYRDGLNWKGYNLENSELTKFRLLAEKSMTMCIPTIKGQVMGFKTFQKFIMTEEFQKLLGYDTKDISMIMHHSVDVFNLNFDFESKKQNMLEFAEANKEKYILCIHL